MMNHKPVVPVRCDGRCGATVHVECEFVRAAGTGVAVCDLWKIPDMPEFLANRHGWMTRPNDYHYCQECQKQFDEQS